MGRPAVKFSLSLHSLRVCVVACAPPPRWRSRRSSASVPQSGTIRRKKRSAKRTWRAPSALSFFFLYLRFSMPHLLICTSPACREDEAKCDTCECGERAGGALHPQSTIGIDIACKALYDAAPLVRHTVHSLYPPGALDSLSSNPRGLPIFVLHCLSTSLHTDTSQNTSVSAHSITNQHPPTHSLTYRYRRGHAPTWRAGLPIPHALHPYATLRQLCPPSFSAVAKRLFSATRGRTRVPITRARLAPLKSRHSEERF